MAAAVSVESAAAAAAAVLAGSGPTSAVASVSPAVGTGLHCCFCY